MKDTLNNVLYYCYHHVIKMYFHAVNVPSIMFVGNYGIPLNNALIEVKIVT